MTVFEALHKTGGVLSYGIPEFRLPKKLVQSEVDGVAALGVDFETNVVVGRSITIDELQEQGYQGIFVGSGAGLPRFQGIPGENLNGVYAANEFLTRVNLMKGYQFPDHPTPVKVTDTVCVIGAGNVAMDAARTAKRLGAKNVYIVYRRGPEEVPARAEEVHHAKEEGIQFLLLIAKCRFVQRRFRFDIQQFQVDFIGFESICIPCLETFGVHFSKFFRIAETFLQNMLLLTKHDNVQAKFFCL